MNAEMANLSGSLALRGVLAILFGVAAVFWPGITLVTIVYLFSAFILINGIGDLVFGVGHLTNHNKSIVNRTLVLLFAFVQIGVGVYLLRHPDVSFRVFILLAGFTLIVRGVFEFIAGLFEDNGGMYRAVAIIGGIFAILAGGLLLAQPVRSGVAFVWILGVYALITGPLFLALSLEAKNNPLPANRRAK